MTDQGPWHVPGSSDTTLSLSRHWHSFPVTSCLRSRVSGDWAWSQWFNLPQVTRGSQLALLWMLMSMFRDMQRHETLQNARVWLTWPDTLCMSRAYIMRLIPSGSLPVVVSVLHLLHVQRLSIMEIPRQKPFSHRASHVQPDQTQIMDGTSWIRGQVIGCNGYIGVFDMIYKYKVMARASDDTERKSTTTCPIIG